jgi:Arc/MetJ family transcription regulator
MRMSITLDPVLLAEVMRTFGTTVKREAVEKALVEALRSKRRQEALKHGGQFDLGFDQDDLQALRNQA